MSQPTRPSREWLVQARAIKHQMSNILMGLLGHAELLESHAELQDKSKQKVQLIREQLHRLQDQLDKLNTLCR